MKLRRGSDRPVTDANENASTGTGTSSTSQTVAGASAQPTTGNAQDDVFDKLDPRYKVERKVGEEGNVTNSLAMLTAIPEVDLGMEYVPVFLLLTTLPF